MNQLLPCFENDQKLPHSFHEKKIPSMTGNLLSTGPQTFRPRTQDCPWRLSHGPHPFTIYAHGTWKLATVYGVAWQKLSKFNRAAWNTLAEWSAHWGAWDRDGTSLMRELSFVGSVLLQYCTLIFQEWASPPPTNESSPLPPLNFMALKINCF